MQKLHSSARTAAKTKFKSWGLTTSAKIATILILAAVFISSCDNEPIYKRAYIITKSDDDNWTTSGRIECDSFTMVSNNEIVFFVDGRKSVLKGQIIKCFSNPSYVSVK